MHCGFLALVNARVDVPYVNSIVHGRSARRGPRRHSTQLHVLAADPGQNVAPYGSPLVVYNISSSGALTPAVPTPFVLAVPLAAIDWSDVLQRIYFLANNFLGTINTASVVRFPYGCIQTAPVRVVPGGRR